MTDTSSDTSVAPVAEILSDVPASDDSDSWGFSTLSIRAGIQRGFEGEHCEPIFTTSSFVFRDAAHAAARFGGEEPGNVYSRFTNPTVRTFQDRLAALEGGEACMATASGMAAITAVCFGLLKSGDHIVSSRSIFGNTVALFNNYLQRFGVTVSYAPQTDLAAWEAAIRPQTKLLYVETPSNPLIELADIRALAEIAHAHDCLLVVDNCFCTPALQQPLKLGADLVVHSATKYLDGQGRCVGGAVVGDAQRVGQEIFTFLRNTGGTLSAFNAWVFLKGLETLRLRMRAHSETACHLAHWLEEQPEVTQVYYPGLSSHPQHDLARRQQDHFGGMLSFEVAGGREGAWKVIDSTRVFSITGNLGDTKSTITHPATTTHGKLTPAEKTAVGITDGLIRLSVGLEDLADLQEDLARGLDRL